MYLLAGVADGGLYLPSPWGATPASFLRGRLADRSSDLAFRATSPIGLRRFSVQKPLARRPCYGSFTGAQERSPMAKNKNVAKPAGAKTPKSPAKPVKLLSGGNPQIAKAYGDAPVQAYIDAMPGWKQDVGRRLDEIITRTIPDVRKAVKWNSPLYGVEDQVWFLSFHCFDKYVKVAFFRGASLRPVPPGESKQKDVRYLNVREDDEIDEAQFAAWVKQASQLPGERM